MSAILIVGCYDGDGIHFEDSNTSVKTSTTKCDYLIDKGYFEICYDYNLKGARFVSYKLNGSLVDAYNIDERPDFYVEPLIPSQYASDPEDYTGSIYDRGHLASDASFDYDNTPLHRVYSMANIVPQVAQLNRSGWKETEKLEREKAKLYGSIDVFIGVNYIDNPLRIGTNKIAVPQSFYKVLSNKFSGYETCYLYDNAEIIDTSSDTIEDHEVNCSTLTLTYSAKDSNKFGFSETDSFIGGISEKHDQNPQIIIDSGTSSSGTSGSNMSCTNPKSTCSEMTNCNEAYFYLNTCNITSLDADKDGIPCESKDLCGN